MTSRQNIPTSVQCEFFEELKVNLMEVNTLLESYSIEELLQLHIYEPDYVLLDGLNYHLRFLHDSGIIPKKVPQIDED